MCGIVGLFLKNPALRDRLGARFATMLAGMADRGPDSAGLAVFHDPVPESDCKLTLFAPDPDHDWDALGGALAASLGSTPRIDVRSNHAVLRVEGTAGRVVEWLAANRPDIRVMGYGRSIEVFKDKGLPDEIAARFDVERMGGTHAIGHTRMATESAVTTEHSHPFIAADDVCLVHNGSLSNHNRLRLRLQRRGLRFESDNDTEVAARYFAHRLSEGASLEEAMEAGLDDLDGFYTFAVGTADGFAVLRDAFACKPAVLAETDDWVAMASEFRSLADLPGVDGATIWEPEPSIVYTWSHAGAS
ncbi:MAG: glutamine amidotransferase [Defluviicoccus sp.]|nr:glutamine amidotransferase [Defluviicoccus sp.]